jgi:drug/metabolite transporter (DMT)-like permease
MRTRSVPDARTAGRGLPGLAVAGVTALISGVSVFVNSYGVRAVATPAIYTTAKNLVATVVLGAGSLAAVAWRRRGGDAGARWVDGSRRAAGVRPIAGWAGIGRVRLVALAYVGVAGGGVAFILFFDGLARTTATPAAFLRDTLVIWVAALAAPFLGERITGWNMAAIALLVGGEVAIAHGVGGLAAGSGQLLILGATVLWAVEVVVARWLLSDVAPATLSLVRMGIGSIVLVGYVVATGAGAALASLDRDQIGWILLTGVLLAAYVATWFTALSRARAIDVTSVLVASALVTALLQAMAGTASLVPELLGLILIAAGTVMVASTSPRRRVA